MPRSLEEDLLAAHADALQGQPGLFRPRFSRLFPQEVTALESLLSLAEQLSQLMGQPSARPDAAFRARLKAELLADMAGRQALPPHERWRWAAFGASAMTVAGMLAAAWRNQQQGRD